MRSLDAKLFAELETRKKQLLAEIVRGRYGRLRFGPANAGWSVLEVLDHLQKTEASILLQMMRKLQAAQPVPLKDRVQSIFLLILFRLPSRVSIPPAARQIQPSATAALAEITDAWSQTRLHMRDFLKEVSAEDAANGLFRHPVSGWMTLATTLSFLSAHIVHHRYQLKRIERSWRQQGSDAANPLKV